MNTDYQKDAAMAVLFKEEVDRAKPYLAHGDPTVAWNAKSTLELLERLAKRYSACRLTSMTTRDFLEDCGLAP